MILSLMMFVLAVGSAAAAAAWLADQGLRRLGQPSRFAWAGALASGPLLLTFGLLPVSVPGATGAANPLSSAAVDLPGLVIGDGGMATGWVGSLAGGLWVASTVLFLALVLRARGTLVRDAATWRSERVLGCDVLVADRTGPAVAGTLRPRIVLPDWALDLPERQLRMVLAHEQEHVRAGDARLLGAALAVVAAAPWNPIGWWMFYRLRAAIEIDCDRRVLRRDADPLTYGESLLSVAARASRPPLALAAFTTESSHSLERRILAMTARTTPRTRMTGVLLLAIAALVGVQACGVESPMDHAGDEFGEPSVTDVPAAIAAEPTFTPFTVAPEIRNREEVIAAMARSYPPLLRDAGIGGAVRVYFLISDQGRVVERRIDQSSGHEALDQAALAVAAVYRFSPALNRDQPVPVWVSFPITFRPDN